MMYLLDKSAFVNAQRDPLASRELETIAAREPIAAVAKHYRATVLHYDSDFDHISRVEPGVWSRWIVPRQRGGAP